MTSYRNEYVEQILQRWQLRYQLLHDLREGLEYGVIVDGGQMKAQMDLREAGIGQIIGGTLMYIPL